MHSEESEECCIWFWRQGVRFIIDLHGSDIQGTELYNTWRPLLRETPGEGENMQNFFIPQWHSLCDLVIPQAKTLLEQLAPEKPAHWATLRDYLHCPSYRLKLTASETKSIVPKVTNGPGDNPAYEMSPADPSKFAEIEEALELLHQYDSNDVEVLDKEVNWRLPPCKVRTSDSVIFEINLCERDSRSSETGKVFNDSIDSINAMLKVYRHCRVVGAEWPATLPELHGIVVDVSKPSSDSQNSEDTLDGDVLTPKPSTGTQASGKKSLIAGLLVAWIPNKATLFDLLRDASDKLVFSSRIPAWKDETRKAAQDLHERGFYWGSNSIGWRFMNYHTVSTDTDNKIWLTTSILKRFEDGIDDEEVASLKKIDMEAIDFLFDVWMVGEINKGTAAA